MNLKSLTRMAQWFCRDKNPNRLSVMILFDLGRLVFEKKSSLWLISHSTGTFLKTSQTSHCERLSH